MKPEECPKLDECSKVKMIFDKDFEDFQYVQAMREVCAKCRESKGPDEYHDSRKAAK